jgi:hypothetical protein
MIARAAVLIGAVVLIAGGARLADPPKTIEAERFLVRGKDGKSQLALFINEFGTPYMNFTGADGKERLGFGLDQEGRPVLKFKDKGEQTRLGLAVDQDGTPMQLFVGKDGKPALAIGLRGARPGLVYTDQLGRRRLGLYLVEDGSPHLVFKDEAEADRLWMSLAPGGVPQTRGIRP